MRWNLYFQSTCHFKTAFAGKRLIIDPLRLHPPVSCSVIRPSIIQHPNAASAGSFAAIRSTHLQPPPFHAFVRSSRSFIARTNHSIHIHTSNRGQDSKRHSDQAARRRSLASSLSLSLSLFHLRSRTPFVNGDPAFRLMFDDLYNVSIDRHTARISLLPLLPISLSLTLLLAYLRRNAVRDFIDFISYGEIRFALSYVACFIPRCIQAKFTLFLPLSPCFSLFLPVSPSFSLFLLPLSSALSSRVLHQLLCFSLSATTYRIFENFDRMNNITISERLSRIFFLFFIHLSVLGS